MAEAILHIFCNGTENASLPKRSEQKEWKNTIQSQSENGELLKIQKRPNTFQMKWSKTE